MKTWENIKQTWIQINKTSRSKILKSETPLLHVNLDKNDESTEKSHKSPWTHL